MISPFIEDNFNLIEDYNPQFSDKIINSYLEQNLITEVDIEILPSEIETENLITTELDNPIFIEDYYDPFIQPVPRYQFLNEKAFQQNSMIEYNEYDVNGSLILVGADNSIFTIDLMQTLRDLSSDIIVYKKDDHGNEHHIIVIESDVASNLADSLSTLDSIENSYLSPQSSSYHSLFSGLTEERLNEAYERDIRLITTESVQVDTPTISSIHIDSPNSTGG
jgi:hypothetical protein